jgi:hypothetical protein
MNNITVIASTETDNKKMIYRKLISKAEKRLNYLINEALSQHVRDASHILSVIADEFSIKTGITIAAWINDEDFLRYSSDDMNFSTHISIINTLREEKVTDNSWFGADKNMFYKTFGVTPYGSFSILIECTKHDSKEKKAAIASLAIRVFNKLDIWFCLRETENHYNKLGLPEPLYYYDDIIQFYPYRGAAYLRWYNDKAYNSYEFTSLDANEYYQYWLDLFIDKKIFNVAYDAGCLVLLLNEYPHRGSYSDVLCVIHLIEESLGQDDKLLWAVYFDDNTLVTTKNLEDLRAKVLSYISGDIYYQSYGEEYDIVPGKEIEHGEKIDTYDYWDELDNKIYKECCERAKQKPKAKNPFVSYFSD